MLSTIDKHFNFGLTWEDVDFAEVNNVDLNELLDGNSAKGEAATQAAEDPNQGARKRARNEDDEEEKMMCRAKAAKKAESHHQHRKGDQPAQPFEQPSGQI